MISCFPVLQFAPLKGAPAESVGLSLMDNPDDLRNSPAALRFGRAVAVLGILTYTLSLNLTPSRLSWELAIVVLLAYYGERRSVRLPGYGFLNPGEGFYLAAACLWGPAPGGLLAFLLGVAGDLRQGKVASVILFNTGWALATFGLVGAVYPYLGWPGAALSYIMVAAVLQALGERTFSGLALKQTLGHQLKEMVLVAPAAWGLCYLTVSLLSYQPWTLFLLVLPLELVVTYVRTRELSRELAATLRELERTQAELVATGRQAALGVMAAGVAHEINNPLAAALTNVHTLKMVASNPSTAPSFGLLEKSLDRCQSIVARMLKYSRKPKPGGSPCELAEILSDALLFCGRKFGEAAGVKLEGDLTSMPAVKGDPTELVQILSNLLANAHDAGPRTVRLEADLLGSEEVVLRVTDDGAGIPPQLQERIFEPFFTTKAVGSGTGLGLSIAQGLARSYGGNLELSESSPGRTEFCLTLPVF